MREGLGKEKSSALFFGTTYCTLLSSAKLDYLSI